MEKTQQIYNKYFFRKLIEALKALALDYEVQVTLLPKEILWATSRELIDEYDVWFHHRNQLLADKLISQDQFIRLEKLNTIIDLVVKEKLWELDDLKNNDEWKKVRDYSREILMKMGKKIERPIDITWKDIE